jgi:Zn finger protein HypA/HybF involved in hydrogenase expression
MRVGVKKISQRIMEDFPSYDFIGDDDFYFDAASECIYYDASALHTPRGAISLLHEIAHAELAHFDYRTDFELFAMESQAWMKTRALAQHYHIPCSDTFIQHCLTSYGKWVEARSTCPTCTNFSLQENKNTYRCFSCQTRWHIAEGTEASIRRVKLDE